MTREGEGGAREDRVRFEWPGWESCDEPGGLKWIFLVDRRRLRRRMEIGSDEAERSVLGAEMKEVVVLRLTFFIYATAWGALSYRSARARSGAPSLRRWTVRTFFFFLFTLFGSSACVVSLFVFTIWSCIAQFFVLIVFSLHKVDCNNGYVDKRSQKNKYISQGSDVSAHPKSICM